MTEPAAISKPMADLYDVFVDWPGRLGREMPGLTARLAAVGARRVLDVGCGTGRHVAALLEAGFDACGADASDEMLAQARPHLAASGIADGNARLFTWRLGDAPPSALIERAGGAGFDAVIGMGNLWTLIASEQDTRGAARAFEMLVRPGGLVLLGLKALGVRREAKNPYMPLMKRQHEGTALWFVRFVDFQVPPLDDGTEVCDLHMAVVSGEASDGDALEARLHRASRVRVWTPDGLVDWFEARGFVDVRVGGSLPDPEAPATTEDVYLSARLPG
jgi:SAM-dependent methyltransferase